jgi:hypothetical protein
MLDTGCSMRDVSLQCTQTRDLRAQLNRTVLRNLSPAASCLGHSTNRTPKGRLLIGVRSFAFVMVRDVLD